MAGRRRRWRAHRLPVRPGPRRAAPRRPTCGERPADGVRPEGTWRQASTGKGRGLGKVAEGNVSATCQCPQSLRTRSCQYRREPQAPGSLGPTVRNNHTGRSPHSAHAYPRPTAVPCEQSTVANCSNTGPNLHTHPSPSLPQAPPATCLPADGAQSPRRRCSRQRTDNPSPNHPPTPAPPRPPATCLPAPAPRACWA